MDALIRASAGLKFHIISLGIASQPRVRKFVLPHNVTGLTDIILDVCPPGHAARSREGARVSQGARLMQTALTGDPGNSFQELVDLVHETGFGQVALLDARKAWTE